MTDDILDEFDFGEFKQDIQGVFKERKEEFKNIKDPIKCKEIAQIMAKERKEMMSKPVEERWFYTDEYGYDWILINTPKDWYQNSKGEFWNKPKKDPNPKDDFPNNYIMDGCAFPMFYGLDPVGDNKIKNLRIKGNFRIFYEYEEIEPGKIKPTGLRDILNKRWLVRGIMTIQYQVFNPNGKDKYLFRKEFLKETGVSNVNEVDRSLFATTFNFQITQEIDIKERK